MKKRIMKTVLILSYLIILAGCAVGEKERGTSGAGGQSEGLEDDSQSQTQEDDDIYQTDYISIEESEKQTINERISDLGSLCKDIYVNADKGESSNIVLQEDVVHEMVQTAASRGLAVTCGSYDYNMLNYETVDQALNNAAEGGKTETEFHEITASGYFRYFKLSAKDQELTVTYANASYNDDLEMQIRQMEKFRVYDWEYTEKGWLIWEKALSKNQEMDMHSFFRVLPLDEKCREMCDRYILPVSYFCNNLFLTDWDAGSMDRIEFNDLYEFLYEMKYGEKLDEEAAAGGIPKVQFEEVVLTYFDISAEQLEKYARYDAAGVYPWEPVNAWNRVRQMQPFPEVVRCVEDQDGTLTLYVEGILIVAGDDCAFRHRVTMRERDGRWVYVANDIDEGENNVPGYIPRREF
ncbi:MAG TPA: hypothetical protein H9911_08365 [Candidatus Mediterraneibacter tabaqchaliae]|uniref:Uncharacterized protein n=1 Tax=Candidatus Mediterraneibacter tabaqchaliae TaxID=2838689 RepID=A0A9D2R6C9_9FIRM|nr:hypothetical protein [Candidatus Mediterraneibacter tabaqchaliae]